MKNGNRSRKRRKKAFHANELIGHLVDIWVDIQISTTLTYGQNIL